MAIASLVCAFLFAPLGIIFGHISLSQIRKTGEDGHGLAIAGLVISYLITIGSIFVLLGVMLFAIVFARSVNEHMNELNSRYPSYSAAPSAPGNQLPDFAPPANLGANCAYPSTTEPASKPNRPPRSGRVPTDPARVSVSMTTNDGNVGLQLDNAKAPCTVNSFASLAQQGYFDGTTCHRLTTSSELGVLQCGDPSGTGQGGPGYRFANEYPTNQYRLSDPALQNPVVYPRGTVAMANAGSGTNGSQFFLVYADSMLPPTYTAFGKIDATGLATLDNIAAAGVDGGSDDGKPAKPVTIQSVRLD
jgi:peptidyl-prolyl cis-trans isomerase B (cyclophilin B)